MTDPRPLPAFAHASEAELARILDFYEVSWEYEPHTFPILYDRQGNVLESFSPDFYLPDLDVYVELTTLRQALVRKKNRKLRRLRELYPGIRIKLLYARDFRALLLKYGRIAFADAFSGAEGQATPPRRPAAAPSATPGSADDRRAPARNVHGGRERDARDRDEARDRDDARARDTARGRRSRRTRAEARAARAAADAAATAAREAPA